MFVRTKRGASRLATRLEHRGVRVAALHGDMTQSQRDALPRALRARPRRHARGDRRRGARPRHRRDHARRQLRSAGRRSELRAPQSAAPAARAAAARASRSCSTISARPSTRWPRWPASTSRAASAPTRCSYPVPAPATQGHRSPRAAAAAGPRPARHHAPPGRVAPRPAAQPRDVELLNRGEHESFVPPRFVRRRTGRSRTVRRRPGRWSVILSAGITERARKLSVMNGAASVEPSSRTTACRWSSARDHRVGRLRPT